MKESTKKMKIKIRKNDNVIALSGKDKGKTGKVLKISPYEGRAIVEGVNLVKKHMRKTRQDQQGGIVHRENFIDMSNLALVCKNCNRPTRIGLTTLSDGSKSRFCKKCKEMV